MASTWLRNGIGITSIASIKPVASYLTWFSSPAWASSATPRRTPSSAACTDDASLALGVNTHGGYLVNAAVGEAAGLDTVPLRNVLASR